MNKIMDINCREWSCRKWTEIKKKQKNGKYPLALGAASQLIKMAPLVNKLILGI